MKHHSLQVDATSAEKKGKEAAAAKVRSKRCLVHCQVQDLSLVQDLSGALFGALPGARDTIFKICQ
jgi:hypothetical protein